MSDLSSRLADSARASGVVLDERQRQQLEDYLRLLARWNGTINLTSLPMEGFPDATLNRLVVEAFVASRLMPTPSSPASSGVAGGRTLSWFDLGSGGGSPAIPLKIVRPDLRLTMVESRERKSVFLREAIRALGLQSAVVMTERLEDIYAVNIDIITVRAVSGNNVLAEAVSRMLARDGTLLMFGGATPPQLAGMELDLEAPLVSAGDRLFVMTRSGSLLARPHPRSPAR